MRTIYIRSNPLRVVVKPHPGTAGTNLLHAATKAEADEHAAKLNAQFGWPVIDET